MNYRNLEETMKLSRSLRKRHNLPKDVYHPKVDELEDIYNKSRAIGYIPIVVCERSKSWHAPDYTVLLVYVKQNEIRNTSLLNIDGWIQYFNSQIEEFDVELCRIFDLSRKA